MRVRSIEPIVAFAALFAMALAGCTSSAQEPTLEASPAVVDFTTAAQSGTPVVVHMPVDGFVAVFGTDTEFMEDKYWNATISDPSVLEFRPFDGSGRAASLPLLAGLADGAATAVITYTGGTSPETVTYEVTVGDG